MIILKTPEEIKILNEANKITHKVLDEIQTNIKAGITTKVLDNIAEKMTLDLGGVPAFKGYKNFPASLCVSINEQVVHGIPNDRIIKEGDIVSIDFGVKYKGYFGDAARTIIVGDVPNDIKALVENTQLALLVGANKVRAGNRLHDICGAIENIAKTNNYGIVKNFGGHGVGVRLHEDPFIPNYIDVKIPNIRLQEGMVLAIEPMFNLGTSDVKILDDKWTVITTDNFPSAHWEYSVAIVEGKPLILGV